MGFVPQKSSNICSSATMFCTLSSQSLARKISTQPSRITLRALNIVCWSIVEEQLTFANFLIPPMMSSSSFLIIIVQLKWPTFTMNPRWGKKTYTDCSWRCLVRRQKPVIWHQQKRSKLELKDWKIFKNLIKVIALVF